MNCDTAFTIPLFGGIPVAESVVVTWVIMAVLLIAAAILGRNLKVENVGKKQLVLETIVGGLYNFFYDLLGEEGKQYIPYLMTVGGYIGSVWIEITNEGRRRDGRTCTYEHHLN